jgi:hypothetical protein
MTGRSSRSRSWPLADRTLAAAIALGLALSAATAQAAEKRPLPDYDGRKKQTTPTDVALWVPRVVLFPAYVLSEYVIRRPLGYLITEAERAELPSALYDFFAFGPDHKSGVVPVGFVDFGFNPSVGLYSFWDDAGFAGHDLRVNGSTWGERWLSGTITERFRFSESRSLTLTGTLLRRPDYAFYGIGPATRESALSRYSADKADTRLVLRTYFWRSSSVESTVGYRGVTFGPGHYDQDPSITTAVARGAFPIPSGFGRGYRAFFSGIRLAFDTRTRKGGTENGFRVEVETEQGANPTADRPSGWVRWGGSIGGFLDLNGQNRVVGFAMTALAADPLGSTPVPFTELVSLGGNATMPGFRAGRLCGESALVGTLRYSWPIWMWLDGSLQLAIGNVYGSRWRGASWEQARMSTAIGVESNNSRDSIFQALVGIGTETFESGAAVNSLRVVAGVRHGY